MKHSTHLLNVHLAQHAQLLPRVQLIALPAAPLKAVLILVIACSPQWCSVLAVGATQVRRAHLCSCPTIICMQHGAIQQLVTASTHPAQTAASPGRTLPISLSQAPAEHEPMSVCPPSQSSCLLRKDMACAVLGGLMQGVLTCVPAPRTSPVIMSTL